jgi:hypothetical protein
MAKYTQAYFDGFAGIVEQLFYAVVTLKSLNQEYTLPALTTDYATNSADWSLTIDYGQSAIIGITMTFPTLPFQYQMLLERSGLDRRIAAVNPLNVDELSISHSATFTQSSFPVKLPAYLNDDDDNNNILERRIVALCLQVVAIENWIERWNICAAKWVIRNYYVANYSNGYAFVTAPPLPSRLPDLATIEAERDELLAELSTGCQIKALSDYIIQPSDFPAFNKNEAGTADELLEYYANGNYDTGGGGGVAGGLLGQLDASEGGGNPFGDATQDKADNRTEDPTLSAC